MNEHQRRAIQDAKSLQAESGALIELVNVSATDDAGNVTLDISINCQGFPRAEAGVHLHQRERFNIRIPPEFPFKPPTVTAPHRRFATTAHVQWGTQLCLYRSSENEWAPQGGIAELIKRLIAWLAAAAQNTLDPVGGPLHPPAVYQHDYNTPLIIFSRDLPPVDDAWWIGSVGQKKLNEKAIELGNWVRHEDEKPKGKYSGALLLRERLPFEYPTTLQELRASVEEQGVPFELITILLQLAALTTEDGEPALLVLGAPYHETDAGRPVFHLACWQLDVPTTSLIREKALADDGIAGVLANISFDEWIGSAKIEWCRTSELRPEVAIRRDHQSPVTWWKGKSVAVIGCGAIGSHVGAMLARAGIGRALLIDRAIVTPGLLVRQNFRTNHIGYGKAACTRQEMRYIISDLEIDTYGGSLQNYIASNPGKLATYDAIINATASLAADIALEKLFGNTSARPPVVSLVIGHRAEAGLVTLCAPEGSGVSVDLDRRAKLALATSGRGGPYLDEFWPLPGSRTSMFQPEPGCSDPTFIGSATDVSALVSGQLNSVSRWLAISERRTAFAAFTSASFQPPSLQFSFDQDVETVDTRRKMAVRIRPKALTDARAWIRKSQRERGINLETGGIIFGDVDESLGIAWIDEVSGPPPDSIASAAEFICGTIGVAALATERMSRSRGSSRFVGMWHTHPIGSNQPSPTDVKAMRSLWEGNADIPRYFVMMIGGHASTKLEWSVSIFGREDFDVQT